MRREDITAYILAYNERENISRCLTALSWLPRVVVVDSISTDGTQEIARGFQNAEVVERPFDNLRNQHSFALSLVKDSPWVLRLDADWIISDDFRDEVTRLAPGADVHGFRVPFRFALYGQEVPIALYPPVVCLFRPANARYIQDGHTERLVPGGPVMPARACIWHDDRKQIDRFMLSQIRYSRDEMEKIYAAGDTRTEELFRSPLVALKHWLQRAPGLSVLGVVFYLGVLRLGLFRGKPSRHYILQRAFSELAIALRGIDADMKNTERT